FGTLYPPQYENVREGTERSQLHAECLMRATEQTELEARVRFLQLAATESGLSWAQAVEHNFQFSRAVKQLDCQRTFGFSVEQKKLAGSLRISRHPVEDSPGIAGIHRLCIELANDATSDALHSHDALSCAFVSAHIILAVNSGEFVSLLDPP